MTVSSFLLQTTAVASRAKGRGCSSSSSSARSGSPHWTILSATALGDGGGMYRPFAEHAWDRILNHDGGCLDSVDVPNGVNSAVSGKGSVTSIEIKAATAKTADSPIQYARYALLETTAVPDDGTAVAQEQPADKTAMAQAGGIQVLNLVIFPRKGHAVFGADFVTLPGNKHLLLLDAQPVSDAVPDPTMKEWYKRQRIQDFPWGGDLPEKVLPYVSETALWTRLVGDTDPVSTIHGSVTAAATDLLDVYLDSIQTPAAFQDCRLQDYVRYRLDNDPARPMLKRLYGETWTEEMLENVLFPKL